LLAFAKSALMIRCADGDRTMPRAERAVALSRPSKPRYRLPHHGGNSYTVHAMNVKPDVHFVNAANTLIS
jgi:hypothetical protein